MQCAPTLRASCLLAPLCCCGLPNQHPIPCLTLPCPAEYLGSKSTFPGGAMGGHQGRALRPGDMLFLAPADTARYGGAGRQAVQWQASWLGVCQLATKAASSKSGGGAFAAPPSHNSQPTLVSPPIPPTRPTPTPSPLAAPQPGDWRGGAACLAPVLLQRRQRLDRGRAAG